MQVINYDNEKVASEDDILEAYCRDVDAYSFEFNKPEQQQQNTVVTLTQPAPQQVGLQL